MRRAWIAVVLSVSFGSGGGPAHSQAPTLGAARWAPGAAIQVWIGEPSARRDDPALVERAMASWTNAAAGRLRLERSNDEAGAGIRVRFATGDSRLGETSPLIDRRTRRIVSAEVAIAENIAGDTLTQQIVIYMTALHELGHALGLPHSDEFEDIMYAFRRPDDAERYFGAYRKHVRSAKEVGSPQATGLSARDVTMLLALYRE